MKTFGFRTLLISGLFVAVQAFAVHPAQAGPPLCNGEPNGIVDGDEQCETGPCCTAKCELKSADAVCRPSADDQCDIAETCGEQAPAVDAACPADVVEDDGTECDDGLFCTTDDVCTAGTCGGAPNTCDDGNDCTVDECAENGNRCTHDNADDGASCEDGTLCTTGDTCERGECISGEETVCVDENECTNDKCDDATGECVFENNTKKCDDGLFCTEDDSCSEGVCTGAATVCDDGDPCTVDSCDEEADSCGGSAADNGTPCDDGLFCTIDDTCADGVCVGGGPNTCDDENACTADSCHEPSDTCRYDTRELDGTTCDDGSLCTTGDTCDGGECVAGDTVECFDDDICTDDSCDAATGLCVFAPNTAPCDDGLFCTDGDTCGGGECLGGAGNGCDDGDACTTDSCDEETDGCTYGAADDGTVCDDGEFCTLDDVCTGGVCSGATENTCDDGNSCTSDSCNEGNDSCKYSPTNNGDPCEDGSFCTVGDTCASGECIGEARDCNDDNICTDDSCNEGNDVCDNLNNSAPCDDGLFCTSGDTCGGGTCSVNSPTCDDANVCTTDICNEEADSCSNENNTDPCEDGSFCTVNDTCSGGACGSGPARDCDDDNGCTNDSCNEDSDVCDNVNNTNPCDDGLFCTEVDTCSGGICAGTARDCGDENGCTDDSCNELSDSCDNLDNAAACDDGLFCTANDVCAGGECTAGPANDCDDDNVCTDDTCNEDTDTCDRVNNTGECSDGDVCTIGDECEEGVCIPGELDPGCTTTTTVSSTTTTTISGVCGDFNGDGEITSSDALAVLQAAVGSRECSLSVCDFTGDGQITAIDALAVLRAAVGLPNNPMCPEAAL